MTVCSKETTYFYSMCGFFAKDSHIFPTKMYLINKLAYIIENMTSQLLCYNNEDLNNHPLQLKLDWIRFPLNCQYFKVNNMYSLTSTKCNVIHEIALIGNADFNKILFF